MFEPEDTRQQPADTLQVGPPEPPPWREGTPSRRPWATTALAFVLGVTLGAGALWWWPDEPETKAPVGFDEHAVELVLFEALPPWTRQGGSGVPRPGPLRIQAAFLLSGAVTSMVLTIESPHHGVAIRARGLPVTVSPDARYRPVDLRITVQDCTEATEWSPTARPFSITWRDENDRMHRDRAGDFDPAMANTLVRYIEVACAEQGS